MEKLKFTHMSGPGTQYHRANRLILDNSSENLRSVVFVLEQVTNTDTGGQVKVDAGSIHSNAPSDTARGEDTALVDLEGVVLGTVNLGVMYDTVLLYLNSYMIHIARQQGRLGE